MTTQPIDYDEYFKKYPLPPEPEYSVADEDPFEDREGAIQVTPVCW